ncbi:MAG TPA: ATP-binding protein [Candidatus Cybelea sp.]|nr:ATP-binding protein [Candidatus Cybelea sp.]
MCNLGVLWHDRAGDATTALALRRRFVEELRRHDGWQIDEEAAKIIFTELVANAALHAPGAIDITVTCADNSISLQVKDSGSAFEWNPRLPPPISESGRGVFIVSRFAESVDVKAVPSGKMVTAILPRRLHS